MTARVNNDIFCQFRFEKLDVTARDITTVGKALLECDPKYLLAVLLDTEMKWQFGSSMLDSRSGESLVRRIASVLEVMRTLCPQDSNLTGDKDKNPYSYRSAEKESLHSNLSLSNNSIVVPCERFEALDGYGMVNRRVDAALIDIGVPPRGFDTKLSQFEHVYSVNQIKRVKKEINPDSLFNNWGWCALRQSLNLLSSESWPDALNLRIWLPSSLTSFERYCVLGSIFWAMTYYGLGNEKSLFHIYGIDANRFYRKEDIDRTAKVQDDMPSADFFCYDRQFYDELSEDGSDLVGKMKSVVELLNYNCWVDFISVASALTRLNKAA